MDFGRHQRSLSQNDYPGFVKEGPEAQQGVFTYPGSHSKSVVPSYYLRLGLPGTKGPIIIIFLKFYDNIIE